MGAVVGGAERERERFGRAGAGKAEKGRERRVGESTNAGACVGSRKGMHRHAQQHTVTPSLGHFSQRGSPATGMCFQRDLPAPAQPFLSCATMRKLIRLRERHARKAA